MITCTCAGLCALTFYNKTLHMWPERNGDEIQWTIWNSRKYAKTLNLEGRISIEKALALPKMTHLVIVLPELDEQMTTKTEQLILKFIWKIWMTNLNKGKSG